MSLLLESVSLTLYCCCSQASPTPALTSLHDQHHPLSTQAAKLRSWVGDGGEEGCFDSLRAQFSASGFHTALECTLEFTLQQELTTKGLATGRVLKGHLRVWDSALRQPLP